MSKKTVLQLVTAQFPQNSKDSAQALIVCKNVYVNGELCTNPKQLFSSDSVVEIIYPKYVSRGGFKLEKALDCFKIDVSNRVFVDAGSSTGGFTDCLLQRGASFVHSVDVGWNLIDYKIRSDSRCIVHEKTNIMALESSDLNPSANAAVADLSFRSISKVAVHLLDLTTERWAVALIKPQFEVPKWQENFYGVICDKDLLAHTLENVWDILNNDKVGIVAAVVSPIKGHKGNTEFLTLLKDVDACDNIDKKSFVECCLHDAGVII